MSDKTYELVGLDTGRKATLKARGGTLGPDCLSIANLLKDQGVFTFDSGFMATAACESKPLPAGPSTPPSLCRAG